MFIIIYSYYINFYYLIHSLLIIHSLYYIVILYYLYDFKIFLIISFFIHFIPLNSNNEYLFDYNYSIKFFFHSIYLFYSRLFIFVKFIDSLNGFCFHSIIFSFILLFIHICLIYFYVMSVFSLIIIIVFISMR